MRNRGRKSQVLVLFSLNRCAAERRGKHGAVVGALAGEFHVRVYDVHAACRVFSLQAGHTGRIEKQGAGIIHACRAIGIRRAHAADALFDECEATRLGAGRKQ